MVSTRDFEALCGGSIPPPATNRKTMNYKKTTVDGKLIDEHRAIVERHLGRKLAKGEVVHHINGNRRDNRIENLAVMSASDHARLHAKKQDLSKFVSACAKWHKENRETKCRAVDCFTRDGVFVKRYLSIRDVEADGFKNEHVCNCCRGLRKSHGGYVWKYAA